MAERRAPRLTPESEAYTRAVADVRRRLVEFSSAAYSAVGVDDPGMAALVERVVPAVEAAQVRVANLTAVHLARQAGADPIDVDEDLVTLGRGVDPETVYRRPIIVARSALAEHKPFVDAKAAGARRLEQLVTTDVQMAKVRQADQSLRAAGRERFRRVPKGESTCALCLIAATQSYKVGKLLPIHPGCDCGVEEIPAGMDLDDLLDVEALLESTHAKVEAFTEIADRGGRAVDYRKLLITEEHGEIGPLLAWDGQKFSGASSIPAVGQETKAVAAPFDEPEANVARGATPGDQALSGAHLQDESTRAINRVIGTEPEAGTESSVNGNGPGESYPLPEGVRVGATAGGRVVTDRPTYRELVGAGVLAPPDDPYRFFDADNKRRGKPGRPEESIAEWLRSKGVELCSVDENTPQIQGKIPDSVIKAAQVTAEIKTIGALTQQQSDDGLAARRIGAAIRDAGLQSAYAVIDARNVEAHPGQIAAGIRSGVHHRGAALTQVIVVLAAGQHLEWRS
ncbi:hypothetical protein [Mycolicibacterium fortuitum]|uniref:hypothetical protein n=1 Tax=Mycolicibacterium fortuitum TaxID=1766 RepID=UPI002628A59B|nr:hypothetical protein [Mycolicibacterium fortuitum]